MNHSIENFFTYSEKLAAGAQPNIDQMVDLKNDGYEVVVNISPYSTRNAVHNEAEIIEKLGLYYIHFPVDCSDLRPIHYKTFEGIMNGLKDKKVFVHCGGNIKSSNLIHMYDVIVNGIDEKESLLTLYKIQSPEDKWFEYFKTFGMRGRVI
ncbi:MAG: sulfur transferase domain-containing protein [Paludibacter sp.]|nr:sulfur transferase domain-containing protein [Paludibacter sp.]